MKFKIIAAILGLMIAIPGVVIDQGSVDQDSADQDSVNQGPMNQGQGGPMDPGPNEPGAPSSTAPAPEGKNGVARISLIHGDVSTQRGDSKDWSAAALN